MQYPHFIQSHKSLVLWQMDHYKYEIENKPDPRTADGRPLHESIMDSKMWGEIRREARTNTALQKAMEQCIIIYHLSKDYGNSKT